MPLPAFGCVASAQPTPGQAASASIAKSLPFVVGGHPAYHRVDVIDGKYGKAYWNSNTAVTSKALFSGVRLCEFQGRRKTTVFHLPARERNLQHDRAHSLRIVKIQAVC